MYARTILIRALDCIASEGYVTKDAALIAGTQSTAQRVASSLEISPELSAHEEDQYGPKADDILSWITGYTGDNEYLGNCKWAVQAADTVPQKTFGYITSLVQSYARHMSSSTGLNKVTAPNAFAGDPGAKLEELACEVINVQPLQGYHKVSLVDGNGHLITYTVNNDTKKALTIPSIGDKVSVSASVYRNKFTTPFETTLSRPTVKRI